MNKAFIIAIIILVILAVGLFFWTQYSAYSPLQEKQPAAQISPPAPLPVDATGEISRDLDAVDPGDLDREFQEVDRDLEGL